jgi:hypothetical protein
MQINKKNIFGEIIYSWVLAWKKFFQYINIWFNEFNPLYAKHLLEEWKTELGYKNSSITQIVPIISDWNKILYEKDTYICKPFTAEFLEESALKLGSIIKVRKNFTNITEFRVSKFKNDRNYARVTRFRVNGIGLPELNRLNSITIRSTLNIYYLISNDIIQYVKNRFVTLCPAHIAIKWIAVNDWAEVPPDA